MLYSSGSWEGWSDSGPLLFIYFQSHQQQQWGHGAFSASIKKLTHPPQRLLGVVGELWHEMGSTSTRQAQHRAQEQPQVNISEPVRQQQPQDVPWACHITGPSAMTRSNKDQMHVLRSLCPGGPNFWLRCQIKKKRKKKFKKSSNFTVWTCICFKTPQINPDFSKRKWSNPGILHSKWQH